MAGLPFTLRQLEVFERICETQSFREAGEGLGISQASVSNQIKALEEQLGVRLLLRDAGKRPQLTAEGAAFLADLIRFRAASEALALHRRAIPQDIDRQSVEVRALIGPYIFNEFIRPKLGDFFESHPDIQLNVVAPVMFDEMRILLARDDFDFVMFQDVTTASMRPGYRELTRIRCGVFGHPKFLSGGSDSLAPDQLGDLPMLLPPSGTYFEQVFLGMLARNGIKPGRVCGRTGYFDVMVKLIEGGSCVAPSIDSAFAPGHRYNSVLLLRLDDFRLTFFRNPGSNGPEIDKAEAFLTSAVLDDPDYPKAVQFPSGHR